MEIERKFLIKKIPTDLSSYPSHHIEQAYLSEEPVVRIRKKNDDYILTYKSKGLMVREEYEAPLNAASYLHLREKADGKIITKRRYLIPYLNYTIELDVFEGDMAPLVLAEVEFDTREEALAFCPPDWFAKDVTDDPRYHNVNMALYQ